MLDRQKFFKDIKGKVSAEQYAKLQELANRSLLEQPRHHLSRIPLVLPLLGAFGLVSTFYGFEKLLDQTVLINRPVELVIVGVILLLVTGAASKKL